MQIHRRSLIALLGLVLAAGSLAADPVSDSWARAYDRSTTLAQRLAVMQSISELTNADLAPFLEEALKALLSTRERLTGTEAATRTSLVRLLVAELGKYRAREAAVWIWETVQQVEDPVARSEALIALGAVGATDHVDQIATLLRNLSLYRGQRAEGEEILARGAITSLEMLHNAAGYEAVFAASRAGFSDPITKLAESALTTMIPDPTAVLTRIVTDADDSAVELAALRWGLRSQAPSQAKGLLAATALEQALSRVARTVSEGVTLRSLRTEAAQGIGASKGPATAVPLLAKLVVTDNDVGEALAAVDALGAIGGETAAGALTESLRGYNDRQDSGIVPNADQARVLVAVIRALGSVGGDLALAELGRTQIISTYSNAIIREARAAVEKIRG